MPETEIEDILSPDDEPEALSIFDVCETDTSAEENGKWFNDIFDDGSKIDVKIRRMTSKQVIAARRRLEKQYRGKQKRDGSYEPAVEMALMVKLIAAAIIVDWRNILDRDKSVIPYTVENAEQLLTKLPVFRDLVAVYASNLDSFRIVESLDTEKNS